LRARGFGTSVTVLGAVVALAVVFVLREPPTVAPITMRFSSSYVWRETRESPGGLAGDATVREEAGLFAAAASGDARAVHGDTASVYDAATRTQLTRRRSGGGWAYTRTVDEWPPVWRTSFAGPLRYQGLAAVVRSALEDRDPLVGIKPVAQGERRSWRAALSWPGGGRADVVVDERSGLVLWCSSVGPAPDPSQSDAAVPVREEFSARADPAASVPGDARLELSAPPGARVTTRRERRYTYYRSLQGAAQAARFAALEPTVVPDGYALRAVATRHRPGLVAAAVPPDADRLSTARPRQPANEMDLCYTRGLAWFTVAVTHIAGSRQAAADVRALAGELLPAELSSRETTLQYGALAGRTAYTWYAPRGPMLFVSDGRYAVLASGALTRQELIALAEGLEPLER